MRTLVIGASGFLGTSVVRELTTRGHDVVGSSRNRRGYLPMDITDSIACRKVLEQGRFDSVVNLSGAGVTPGTSSNQEMNVVNSNGAAIFARVMSELTTPPWFLHASSSTEPRGNESAESIYSTTKAKGTAAIESQLRVAGLAHSIVRIHNTYGPDQPEGRFVMCMLRKLRRREPVSPNFPERVRDFCFADDVVRHMADILETPELNATFWEIGSGMGMTLELASRLICERVGAPCELVVTRTKSAPDPCPIRLADASSPDFLECTTSFRDGVDAVVARLDTCGR